MTNMITTNSLQDQISAQILGIDGLLDVREKQDIIKTVQELFNLLIEYILANMIGDAEAAKNILTKMSKLLNSIGEEVQDIQKIKASFQSILDNPKDLTSATLGILQGISSFLLKA